jgi:PAS domain S-box-containing protein
MVMANLNALTNHFLHPEIPYFDETHVIIGGIMALLACILSFLLENCIRQEERKSEEGRDLLRRGTGPVPWVLALVWTLLTASLLSWSVFHRQQAMMDEAMSTARTVFEKDMVYYRWAAGQKGLYVPISETTPPNPYLEDMVETPRVRTTAGQELALVNPEYMIRQVYELQTSEHEALGHITSLNPIRAANAADPWERKALTDFEQGSDEIWTMDTIKGKKYFRLMRPMVTEAGCLKCHAQQGYEVGDIRGGISVSLPMQLPQEIFLKEIFILSTAYGALWLLGLLGIFLGSFRVAASIRERELAETHLRAIIDNMLDGLITLNEKGDILSLNSSAARMFGFTASEAVGRDIRLLIRFPESRTGQDPSSPMADIQSAMGTVREFAGLRKDGSSFPLEISVSSMRRGKDTISIIMGRDITEEEIHKAEALRAGQMAAIGELAAGVAHEINNPVNGIINYSQVLLDGMEESGDSASRDILARIIKESERVATIVRNLLAFARQRDEVVEEVHIRPIIVECVDLLLYQFNKDGITVEIDVPEDLPSLQGNPQQLHQVFLNLLTNARYALNQRYPGQDPGKRIAIRSRLINPGGRPFIRTTVTDWGIGIPQNIIDRIFDTLFTTKPPGEGTGVGLSISKGLVRDHEGHLTLESIPGDHTNATVDLPVRFGKESRKVE